MQSWRSTERMKPSRPATAPVRPRDPAATRPSTALDAAQKTARWAKLSRELAPLVRPKTASGTRQTFGLADALQLKAQLAVVEREFEGVLAQASAGGERRKFRPSSASPGRRSRSPPRPFTSFTPPAHGAVDGALPNSMDNDDASLEPFMRDFVQEWRASFDREKASYKSFVVFMEMKLRQGLLVTSRLGLPNNFRTAVVCDCVERLSAVFGRSAARFLRNCSGANPPQFSDVDAVLIASRALAGTTRASACCAPRCCARSTSSTRRRSAASSTS